MYTSTFRTLRSASLAAMLALGGALLPHMASAASQNDVEARNKQIVTEAFDRWAAGGTTFFTDVLAPDATWTIKGSGPSAGVFRGVEPFVEQAVRPFVSRLSTPVRPVSKQVWADGDHVVIQWDGAGIARDGQPYNNSYAWIFHMRDGKAVEVTAFLDLEPYDDVLRRIPAPTGE
ncbi:nuclear transport factor 2 family protein [Stutzerimonas azotifigens]|uniref:Nuclear transport factor 2 family protein n=1 Tax=Stutzerimonas azotifigens TaxID=291995 RepID=A0ABR5YV29_9GAMM|nr:nuclear transport factor 2 family protein [Stutzerimonas azotifigens]MBA1271777.1 nuclear transport factor 2 family protein [Stutzerimonas azotifigens]